jgi:hypothetical protein
MPHLYLQLQQQLRQWIKPKDKRHLQGFAESVAAILQSGSASLSRRFKLEMQRVLMKQKILRMG